MMVWAGAARGVVRNTGWVLVIISQQIFITNSTATTTIRGVDSEKVDSFFLSLFFVFSEGGGECYLPYMTKVCEYLDALRVIVGI